MPSPKTDWLFLPVILLLTVSNANSKVGETKSDYLEQDSQLSIQPVEKPLPLTQIEANNLIESIETAKKIIEATQRSSSAPCFTPTPESNLPFETIARKLGGNSTGEGCAATALNLTQKETQAEQSENDATWACIMLRKHLDADKMEECTPDPSKVFRANSYRKARTVNGRTHFFPFVNLPYRYQIVPQPDGTVVVVVRIAASGSSQDRLAYQAKLNEAAEIWTQNAPSGFRFQFIMVNEQENPDFQIAIGPPGKRTRYDQDVSTNSTARVIAHEIGHMMGLDDEYDVLHTAISVGFKGLQDDVSRERRLNVLRCRISSLMCSDKASNKIDPYNYYIILRRGICSTDSKK